jgi:molybdopterin-guanine dinucleotide biosynthesis protein A
MKSSAGALRVNSNIWGGRQIGGCTFPTTKLKLHRKRVVHKAKRDDTPISERGFAYGPDTTYYAPTPITAIRTVLSTAIVGTT